MWLIWLCKIRALFAYVRVAPVHLGYEQDFCDIHPGIMHLFYSGTDHLNRKNSRRSPVMSISDELKANILRYHHVLISMQK